MIYECIRFDVLIKSGLCGRYMHCGQRQYFFLKAMANALFNIFMRFLLGGKNRGRRDACYLDKHTYLRNIRALFWSVGGNTRWLSAYKNPVLTTVFVSGFRSLLQGAKNCRNGYFLENDCFFFQINCP